MEIQDAKGRRPVSLQMAGSRSLTSLRGPGASRGVRPTSLANRNAVTRRTALLRVLFLAGFTVLLTSVPAGAASVITLVKPANNGPVSGQVQIQAAATTPPVSWIGFYVDGNLLSGGPSLQYRWNSTQVTNGSHTLLAIAEDANGTVIGSSSVQVTVQGNKRTATPTPIASTPTPVAPTPTPIPPTPTPLHRRQRRCHRRLRQFHRPRHQFRRHLRPHRWAT